MRRVASLAIAVALAVSVGGGCRIRRAEGDSLPPNAGCYVCHMTFVGETLTAIHVAAEILCTDCHGLSAAHANDENIGATPPDRVYTREQIDPHCRSCHETHDAPPDRVIARWREVVESRPALSGPLLAPACTDCHGEHRIARDS